MVSYENLPILKKVLFFRTDWGDWNDVRNFIAKEIYLSPGKNILDIASGYGFVTEKCSTDKKIYCLDVLRSRLTSQKFKRLKNRVSVEGSMWNMPFAKNYFDIVLACHCFPVWDFPLSDAEASLAQIIVNFIAILKDNLAPTGKILITTVNGSHWYYKDKNKASVEIIETALRAKKLSYNIYGWKSMEKNDYNSTRKKILNKIRCLLTYAKCLQNHRTNLEQNITTLSKALLIEAWKID